MQQHRFNPVTLSSMTGFLCRVYSITFYSGVREISIMCSA
jgi:hypothetical protein